MAGAANTPQDTHFVTYRGEKLPCTQANYEEACERLIKLKGLPNPHEFPRIYPMAKTDV